MGSARFQLRVVGYGERMIKVLGFSVRVVRLGLRIGFWSVDGFR